MMFREGKGIIESENPEDISINTSDSVYQPGDIWVKKESQAAQTKFGRRYQSGLCTLMGRS